jgi:hypothetical protein
MTIRFLRKWRMFKPGDTHDGFPEGVCKTMIANLIAEPVEDAPIVEVKVIESPPADKAIRSRDRVKRK